MVCPKCRWEQVGGQVCCRCGLVIAKYHPTSARASAPAGRSTDPRPAMSVEGRRFRVGSVAVVLGTLALGSLWVIVVRSREAPGAGPREAPAAGSPAADSRRFPATPLPLTPSPTAAATPPESAATPEDVTSVACPLDTRSPPGPPFPEPVSSSWYRGAADSASAVREQERTGAPLVVYFYTDWCGYCREFDRELLSGGPFELYLGRSTVKLRVNPEESREAAAFADEFGVTGYPAFFVTTVGGRARLPLFEDGRLRAPSSLIASIETRVREEARGAVGRAVSLRAAGRPAEAVAVLTRALAADPSHPAFVERALAYAEDGALDRALDDLAYVVQQSRDPALYERSAGLLAAASRWDEAIGCWSAFLERKPADARAYLARAHGWEARGLPVRAAADRKRACDLGEAEACGAR